MEIASSAMQFLFASLQAVLACLSLVVSRKDLKVGVSLDTRGTEQYSGSRPNTMVVRIQTELKSKYLGLRILSENANPSLFRPHRADPLLDSTVPYASVAS